MEHIHHWSQPEEIKESIFLNILHDFKAIIESKKNIKINGAYNLIRPILNQDEISFNGSFLVGEDANDFTLERKAKNPYEYQGALERYCDTEGQPYTFLVIACLLITEHHINKEIYMRNNTNTEYTMQVKTYIEEHLHY